MFAIFLLLKLEKRTRALSAIITWLYSFTILWGLPVLSADSIVVHFTRCHETVETRGLHPYP